MDRRTRHFPTCLDGKAQVSNRGHLLSGGMRYPQERLQMVHYPGIEVIGGALLRHSSICWVEFAH